VLLVKVDPRIAGYKPAQLAGLYQRIQQAVNAQPGVRSSALALYTPLSGDNWDGNISIDKNTPEQNKHLGSAWVRVTPGYFETMGMPLVLGRGFTEQDTAENSDAVVVNETFARDFYKDENAIGHRFGRSENTKQQWEIIAVVKSTKHSDPREAGEDTYFLPVQQLPAGASQENVGDLYLRDLVVRASGNPASIAEAVRQAVRGVDDNIPVTRITTMTDQISASFNQEQLIGLLSGIFGGLALVLACVGLYGLMAYAVARRTSEIGLRMALGASRETVLWMVLRESLTLVATGVVIGIPLVVVGARVVKSQLFGIAPYDPLALISALLVLVAIAAVSGFIPARRATKVEPMVALRDE
jgi:predicted permease